MTVIGIRVDSTSYPVLTQQTLRWAEAGESRYICVANVHMMMEAFGSPAFKRIIENSDLVTPDGMPLVWIMRLKGQRNQPRVYGPNIMLHVLDAAAHDNVPIGFYGGMPEVLETLIKRMQACYPNLRIVFSFSPPFRTMSPEEDRSIVEQINQSRARILFVGLGCPKQEIWMAEHLGRVRAVMLGVGAAFDFHSGVKSQAPAWIQKIGLEWFFRLIQEPRRLWRRYLYHNPRFIVLALADLFGLIKR